MEPTRDISPAADPLRADRMVEAPNCLNCGHLTSDRFCSHCGQVTRLPPPTLRGMFSEGFSAFFSYDSRLWRTLSVLVLRPGELTVAYMDGARARFVSPLQLFIWLQAATFFVSRMTFDRSASVNDTKSKDLLLVGMGACVLLCALYSRRKHNQIGNLVCATHLWSFLMVTLLLAYALLPALQWGVAAVIPGADLHVGTLVTGVALLALVAYTPPTLIRVYQEKTWLALLETALFVVFYVGLEVAFQKLLHPQYSGLRMR